MNYPYLINTDSSELYIALVVTDETITKMTTQTIANQEALRELLQEGNELARKKHHDWLNRNVIELDDLSDHSSEDEDNIFFPYKDHSLTNESAVLKVAYRPAYSVDMSHLSDHYSRSTTPGRWSSQKCTTY